MENQLLENELTTQLLIRMNQPVPRYTSYPTAPEWHPMDDSTYKKHLHLFNQTSQTVSIYIHIPFCSSMCLYCGCSVVLNRSSPKQEAYVQLLLKEIGLLKRELTHRPTLVQLHFGGGTPTVLTPDQFDAIFKALEECFTFIPNGEYSIEIDPRTVYGDSAEKLTYLKERGFNRVSFGVQDIDPAVQAAVRRNQSWEMTQSTYHHARALGFEGINIDLIYGLPKQTIESFKLTTQKIAELRPDRIAMFSYAKVPWLKPHQKAIKEEDLPSTEDKFQIYLNARENFLSSGYISIGMDHFSLPEDPLTRAYMDGTLYRNFHGYTLRLADDMISLGITSIGQVQNCYIQNVKTIQEYEAALNNDLLPIHRGKILSHDDLLRRSIIQDLMCHFALDIHKIEEKWDIIFDQYFAPEQEAIGNAIGEGLLEWKEGVYRATLLGRLFIRNVASIFDIYLKKENPIRAFSKGI